MGHGRDQWQILEAFLVCVIQNQAEISLSLDISLGPAGSKGASPPPFFRNIVVKSVFSEIFLVKILFLKIFMVKYFLGNIFDKTFFFKNNLYIFSEIFLTKTFLVKIFLMKIFLVKIFLTKIFFVNIFLALPFGHYGFPLQSPRKVPFLHIRHF